MGSLDADREHYTGEEIAPGDTLRLTGRRWPYLVGPELEYVDVVTVSKQNGEYFVHSDTSGFPGLGTYVSTDPDHPRAVEVVRSYEDAPEAYDVLIAEARGVTPFDQSVRRILNQVGDLLIEKNRSYGDSALNPIRVFSKADRTEQLRVRADDKLARIANGSEYPGDDTLRDLIGYLTLMILDRETA